MARVLEMAARELGDPMGLVVLVKANDRLLHGPVYFSTISIR